MPLHITLRNNGTAHAISVRPTDMLVDVLRGKLA